MRKLIVIWVFFAVRYTQGIEKWPSRENRVTGRMLEKRQNVNRCYSLVCNFKDEYKEIRDGTFSRSRGSNTEQCTSKFDDGTAFVNMDDEYCAETIGRGDHVVGSYTYLHVTQPTGGLIYLPDAIKFRCDLEFDDNLVISHHTELDSPICAEHSCLRIVYPNNTENYLHLEFEDCAVKSTNENKYLSDRLEASFYPVDCAGYNINENFVECSHNKCNCRLGYIQDGWNCKIDYIKTEVRQTSFLSIEPLGVTFDSNVLADKDIIEQLENAIRKELDIDVTALLDGTINIVLSPIRFFIFSMQIPKANPESREMKNPKLAKGYGMIEMEYKCSQNCKYISEEMKNDNPDIIEPVTIAVNTIMDRVRELLAHFVIDDGSFEWVNADGLVGLKFLEDGPPLLKDVLIHRILTKVSCPEDGCQTARVEKNMVEVEQYKDNVDQLTVQLEISNEEDQGIINNFAHATKEQLVETFGSYAPIAALNNYMLNLDRCHYVSERKQGRESRWLLKTRMFRLNDFDVDMDQVQILIYLKQSLVSFMDLSITESHGYVNFEMNLDSWDSYQRGEFEEHHENITNYIILNITKTTLEKNPISGLAQIIIADKDCLDIEGDLESTSDPRIMNLYHAFLVKPDVVGSEKFETCAENRERFQCTFNPVFSKALKRVFAGIGAFKGHQVNFIRSFYDPVNRFCPNLKHVCFIIEFSIQMDVSQKVQNSISLYDSIDHSLNMLKSELPGLMDLHVRATSNVTERRLEPNIQRVWLLERNKTRLPSDASYIYLAIVMATLVLSYNYARYRQFIQICFRVCKIGGKSIDQKYSAHLSLLTVMFGASSFIIEVMSAFEYIKGTRLAVISPEKGIVAVLLIMSVIRLCLLYAKWMFWIKRWSRVVKKFMHDVKLEKEEEMVMKGLFLVITILAHDCIYIFIKIFFFSRYKPAGLQLTAVQIAGPILDVFFVTLSFIDLMKGVMKLKTNYSNHLAHYKCQLFSLAYVWLTCFASPGQKKALMYRQRTFAKPYRNTRDAGRWVDMLLVILVPLSYMVFKFLSVFVDLMIVMSTTTNQDIVIDNNQNQANANITNKLLKEISSNKIELFVNTADEKLKEFAKASKDHIIAFLGRDLVDSFKPRTCVEPAIELKSTQGFINYLPRPMSHGTADEGLHCVNTLEASFVASMGVTLVLAIVGFFIIQRFSGDALRFPSSKGILSSEVKEELDAYEARIKSWDYYGDYYYDLCNPDRYYNQQNKSVLKAKAATLGSLMHGTLSFFYDED